jgi:D-amino-acid dehydrogenase
VARSEVLVLGAGMIGVSVAAHLAKRGVATTLVDRRGAGEETSYGNAGMIEASRMLPIAFPRDPRELARHALGRATQSNFHWTALPGLAPFLLRYWAASSPEKLEASARALRPMLAAAPDEHAALAAEAGVSRLVRKGGWLKVFRTEHGFAETEGDRALADELGVPYQILDRDGALEQEPHLRPIFRKAVYWPETGSCPDPSALTKAYAQLFEKLGGVFVKGDALSLHEFSGGWRVETDAGPVDGKRVVIALGPWSTDLTRRFGLRIPFAVKRGYHLHLAPSGNAILGRSVIDMDVGYALAPMDRGIRVTTGVEFAKRDSPPTPEQLQRVIPLAHELFPLGQPLDEKPWMGSRPATPDSLPIIGPVPDRPGMWLAFGHAHLGFTLGPPTGRLVADMMTGKKPIFNPAPFRADRF